MTKGRWVRATMLSALELERTASFFPGFCALQQGAGSVPHTMLNLQGECLKAGRHQSANGTSLQQNIEVTMELQDLSVHLVFKRLQCSRLGDLDSGQQHWNTQMLDSLLASICFLPGKYWHVFIFYHYYFYPHLGSQLNIIGWNH